MSGTGIPNSTPSESARLWPKRRGRNFAPTTPAIPEAAIPDHFVDPVTIRSVRLRLLQPEELAILIPRKDHLVHLVDDNRRIGNGIPLHQVRGFMQKVSVRCRFPG